MQPTGYTFRDTRSHLGALRRRYTQELVYPSHGGDATAFEPFDANGLVHRAIDLGVRPGPERSGRLRRRPNGLRFGISQCTYLRFKAAFRDWLYLIVSQIVMSALQRSIAAVFQPRDDASGLVHRAIAPGVRPSLGQPFFVPEHPNRLDQPLAIHPMLF